MLETQLNTQLERVKSTLTQRDTLIDRKLPFQIENGRHTYRNSFVLSDIKLTQRNLLVRKIL